MRTAQKGFVFFVLAVLVAASASCTPEPGGGTAPPGAAFYVPPSPLPAGNPGDVIWWRNSNYTSVPNVKAYQVLYKSHSALDQPNAVSGTVIIPTTPYAGPGPRPIVALAPFTLGLGDQCAASVTYNTNSDDGINAALNNGWAVAMTDYEGLGTPGTHTYMVGQSMGRATLDSVRAAMRLPDSGLSVDAPIGITGYSQGGGGAAWAGELAPTYAPELQVKGIVPAGTPADLIRVEQNVEGGFYFGLAVMAAPGLDAAYPELNLASYLNDNGRQEFATATDKCVPELITTFAFGHIADYTTVSPLTSPAWQARLQENRLGNRTPAAPVMLYHSSDDDIIPFDQVQTLKSEYCNRGVKTTLMTGTGGHIGGMPGYAKPMAAYLADRFAGKPAPSSC